MDTSEDRVCSAATVSNAQLESESTRCLNVPNSRWCQMASDVTRADHVAFHACASRHVRARELLAGPETLVRAEVLFMYILFSPLAIVGSLYIFTTLLSHYII